MKNFIFVLLIVCICFEEIFGKTVLHLSSLKYVVVFLLAIIILKKGKAVKSPIPKLISVFYIYIIIYGLLSIPDFFEFGIDGIKVLKNYIWLPILFYIFRHTHSITSYNISTAINIYVKVMVYYCIINLILYFIYVPIWKTWHPYWGRITVGYPTVDVVLICFALILLYFYPNKWHNTKITVYSIILIMSLLGLASGTGILLLILFYGSYMIYMIHVSIKKKNRKGYISNYVKKPFLLCNLFLIVLFSSFLTYIQNTTPELAEALYSQMENRVYIMLGKEEESQMKVNTMTIREEEFFNVDREILQKNVYANVFGIGFGRLSSNPEATRPFFFLESQYHIFRVALGWLGTIWLYLILCYLLFKAIKIKKLNKRYLAVLSILYLLASSFTTGTFSIWGISGLISMLSVEFGSTKKVTV